MPSNRPYLFFHSTVLPVYYYPDLSNMCYVDASTKIPMYDTWIYRISAHFVRMPNPIITCQMITKSISFWLSQFIFLFYCFIFKWVCIRSTLRQMQVGGHFIKCELRPATLRNERKRMSNSCNCQCKSASMWTNSQVAQFKKFQDKWPFLCNWVCVCLRTHTPSFAAAERSENSRSNARNIAWHSLETLHAYIHICVSTA